MDELERLAEAWRNAKKAEKASSTLETVRAVGTAKAAIEDYYYGRIASIMREVREG